MIRKKDLYIGNILPIYSINNKKYEGNAELLELIEKDSDDTLFIYLEDLHFNKKGEKLIRSYYFNYQKWKVVFTDKYSSPFTCIRKIPFFVKKEYNNIENE